MSSMSNCCLLVVVSLFAYIGDVVIAKPCSSTDQCTDKMKFCRNDVGFCVTCQDVCDPSFTTTYSLDACSQNCPEWYILAMPSGTPIVNDIADKDGRNVQGTRVVATLLLQQTENTSADFDVKEDGESIGTVMSLGDMAAICGVIAFIIFCIGLRVLTKEYPCPWFITPRDTKPVKLDENGDEMAELNV